MNAFDYFFENTSTLTKNFVLGAKEQISYADLYRKCTRLAIYLTKNSAANEKILLMSQNNVFFLIVYLAIIKSGRICVPLNPDIEQENLSFIRHSCRAKRIFVNENLKIKHNLSDLVCISDISGLISDPVATKRNLRETNPKSCAEIIFTSGSTGSPKGVMISHKNLIVNTDSIVTYLKLTDKDIVEVVMPFYYCYGLSLLHTHLRAGGSLVLNNTFVFLGSVLNDINKYNCTGFAGVPSHFQMLLRKSDTFKSVKFPSLRYVTQAGGKLHTIFIKEFIESHPEIDFYVMYGQTEATARLSYLPVDKLHDKLGSIGQGIPGVDLKVVNAAGEETAPGETGEIIARGENVMLGYINDTNGTKQVIRNGWLYTGDLGITDNEGFIYLTARQKEIIKVGGRRVSPKEIEEVIVGIPEIIDCMVFPCDDELLGERIKANVVIDKSYQNKITADYIKQYCSSKLAFYKIPGEIVISENIKLSSTGKKIKSQIS